MHWYTSEGKPMHWVEGANGEMRDTTLRDARKYNLYPSWSGISDQLAKPAVDKWFQGLLLKYAAGNPYSPVQDMEQWTKDIQFMAREEADKAATRGSVIHDCMESLWKGQTGEGMFYQPDVMAISSAAIAQIVEFTGTDEFSPEVTFASKIFGYGGMIDLVNDDWLIDYKSKDIKDEQWELYQAGKNPRIAWPNNCQQLAAYDAGYPTEKARQLVNVYIDRQIPGRVIIHQWDEPTISREWLKFRKMLAHWKLDKNYHPEAA